MGAGRGRADLLADTDVLLADEHTSVVDALKEGGGSNRVKPAQCEGVEVQWKHGKAHGRGDRWDMWVAVP